MSAPTRRRSWRSKFVWALAIAAIALRVSGVETSSDRRRPVREWVRIFNRRWFNPLVLRLAGHAPWPVARFEHRGRKSGALHATPLLAWPAEGGFIFPMPYGTEVDWSRNLRHSGEGIVQFQDVRYRVSEPRIVPAKDALPDLPFPAGHLLALSGVRHVTRVTVQASLDTWVALSA